MEIKIGVEKIREKIPPGPTGKLVIGGFIMSGVVKYSIGYLEKGFPESSDSAGLHWCLCWCHNILGGGIYASAQT